jgi:hypothetical protein
MKLGQLLNSVQGKDGNFLVSHFVAGIAGCHIQEDALFSEEERFWILSELSRRMETETAYAPGERRTWRREHLSAEEVAGIRKPRIDDFVVGRLRERGFSPSKTAWPEGRRFALCITHDMDHVSANNWRESWRYYARRRSAPGYPAEQDRPISLAKCVRATGSALMRRHILHRPDRLTEFAEWTKLEDDLGFRSTMYFFAGGLGDWHPWDCNYSYSDRVPFDGRAASVAEIMRELAAGGWEIGLHPSYRAAGSAEWLGMQKRACEEAAGKEVVSVRQHTLQYDPVRTPALQSRAGLLTDSTQGFNDLIGYRAGTLFPYLCWDHQRGATLPLLELPLHVQDGPLMRGAASPDCAVQDTLKLMDEAERLGGCLVILWHPQWLATDSGLAVFRAVLGEAKRRNAWGCGARELAEWWLSRIQGILGEEQRLPALSGNVAMGK